MEVITNQLMNGDKFSETISGFVNWCDQAFTVSAFFTDDTLIKILNNDRKKRLFNRIPQASYII